MLRHITSHHIASQYITSAPPGNRARQPSFLAHAGLRDAAVGTFGKLDREICAELRREEARRRPSVARRRGVVVVLVRARARARASYGIGGSRHNEEGTLEGGAPQFVAQGSPFRAARPLGMVLSCIRSYSKG